MAKIDTNSNVYTIIYATVIVVIVALLLGLASMALSSRQKANVELDRQKQVLMSLNMDIATLADPAATYNEIITEETAGELTYFTANTEDGTKYIIPMRGAGLWGAIWGYMSLNDDKNTVYGTYFSHDGETPGLGGEIKQRYFQERFIGKHIKAEGKVVGLAVEKAGQTADGMEQVDAISGATITSKGVETMIQTTLAQYAEVLGGGCCSGTCTGHCHAEEACAEAAGNANLVDTIAAIVEQVITEE